MSRRSVVELVGDLVVEHRPVGLVRVVESQGWRQRQRGPCRARSSHFTRPRTHHVPRPGAGPRRTTSSTPSTPSATSTMTAPTAPSSGGSGAPTSAPSDAAGVAQRVERRRHRAAVGDVEQADDGRAHEHQAEPEARSLPRRRRRSPRVTTATPAATRSTSGTMTRPAPSMTDAAASMRVADRPGEVGVDAERGDERRATSSPIASASPTWPPSCGRELRRHRGRSATPAAALRRWLAAAAPAPRLGGGVRRVLRRVAP